MGFELTVAARRDHLERVGSAGRNGSRSSYTSVALNGTFDDEAASAVLSTCSDLSRQSADSVVVSMEDITSECAASLETFGRGLMLLRSSGMEVQVAARHPEFHARLRAVPNSRDWLLDAVDEGSSGPRRSVHVDGPRLAGEP